MLQVKFLQGAVSPKNAYQKGGVYTLPSDIARSFVRAGIATIETAINDKREIRNIQIKDFSSNGAVKHGGSNAAFENSKPVNSGNIATGKADKKRPPTRRKASK